MATNNLGRIAIIHQKCLQRRKAYVPLDCVDSRLHLPVHPGGNEQGACQQPALLVADDRGRLCPGESWRLCRDGNAVCGGCRGGR